MRVSSLLSKDNYMNKIVFTITMPENFTDGDTRELRNNLLDMIENKLKSQPKGEFNIGTEITTRR